MSENNSLVSIIMPAYNSEKYIGKAIESVLAQTYNNWELIVIDDASKDNTLDIINDYRKKDSRIKLFQNKVNTGVSATRNIGIELASGDWIAFLDSDDIWLPYKLEKQMKYAELYGAEFLFTGASFVDENGIPYKGIFEIPEKISYYELRKHNVISCSSVLIRKKFFESIKMENDEMHEDYAVWLRILRTGVIAYGVNEPLLIYRISRNSKSGKKIRSIKMTYRVFRYIGHNYIESLYFTFSHILASVQKYINIYTGYRFKTKYC